MQAANWNWAVKVLHSTPELRVGCDLCCKAFDVSALLYPLLEKKFEW